MNITVYTTPGCVQCHYTQTELEKLHLVFTALDVTIDDAAASTVRQLARILKRTMLPIVTVTHDNGALDMWSGFCVDKIRGLAA
jgi:glutaredoxin-like protein NrdH